MIKTVVDKVEDIPEALKEFYEEREGKFYLQTDESKALKSALEREKEGSKKLKEMIAEYQSKFEEAEKKKEKEKLDDGDIEAVIESRLAKYKQDFESKLNAEIATKNSLMSSALKAEIRSNALKNGVNSDAVEDAILRGSGLFVIDDDGSIVAKKDGQVVFGKDGKTPYSISEWLEEIKPNTSHWYADQNKGGAAPGVKNMNSKSKTMQRAQFDKMSSYEKMTFAKEGGKVTD